MKLSSRTIATKFLTRLCSEGVSLQQLDAALPVEMSASDRAFVKTLCFGFCRHYFSLQALSEQLLSKALKAKDKDIQICIMLGVYQLTHLKTPAHAACSQAVASTRQLKKPWASRLVNACLRNFIRQQDALLSANADSPSQLEHPEWMLEKLKADYPESWQAIIAANNQQAPMTLRVNTRQTTRAQYLEQLLTQGIDAQACQYAPLGIVLAKASKVSELPGFAEGLVSVQDEAAQLCAHILAPETNMRILDACAAPGGKTCHLAELTASKDILAIEVDALRAEKISENSQRLGLNNIQIKIAPAEDLNLWWDGVPFDRILLDVPCSGSGVIRRQPDIKLHRRLDDINKLCALQADILAAAWRTLAPKGRLLYSTCSVYAAENSEQVRRFLAKHNDAKLIPLPLSASPKSNSDIGTQVLPGQNNMDGFFYALLEKTSA